LLSTPFRQTGSDVGLGPVVAVGVVDVAVAVAGGVTLIVRKAVDCCDGVAVSVAVNVTFFCPTGVLDGIVIRNVRFCVLFLGTVTGLFGDTCKVAPGICVVKSGIVICNV
jgi:hypothetical protein